MFSKQDPKPNKPRSTKGQRGEKNTHIAEKSVIRGVIHPADGLQTLFIRDISAHTGPSNRIRQLETAVTILTGKVRF